MAYDIWLHAQAAEATWARGMALSPDSKYLVLATDQGADAAADVSDLNGRQGGASSAGVTAGFVVAYAVDGATGALTEAARTSLPTGCTLGPYCPTHAQHFTL